MTPTEDLFMEVLAGRARCGEQVWTFGREHLRTAKSLEAEGLIIWKHGVVEGTIIAFLTDEGRRRWLSGDYQTPIIKDLRKRISDEIACLPAENARGSRDFGRGYSLAVKDAVSVVEQTS